MLEHSDAADASSTGGSEALRLTTGTLMQGHVKEQP